jgi:nicotinamidase-related amidase
MSALKMPSRRSADRHDAGEGPPKRVVPDESCGLIIDVQEFFLSQLDKGVRARVKANIASFARLLGYFRIPIVATLERSVAEKGALPKEIARQLKGRAEILEKEFFDLTREKAILERLAGLNKRQAIVAGCETDVCVLQSCLGLLEMGYQVFLVEELLFSGSRSVAAAIARMQVGGAVVISYKTLYYELLETVGGSPGSDQMLEAFGPFPDDLPDRAHQ